MAERVLALELEANEQLWESHQLQDYDNRLQRTCFCGPTILMPVNTHISGDSVMAIDYPGK